MANHKIYSSIVNAVKAGRLKEPFDSSDFRKKCPGFANDTYNVFLSKHALGNPGGNTELFERKAVGSYILLRPFKYNL